MIGRTGDAMTLQNSLRELAVLLELVEKVKKVILDYSWIPLNYRHNLIRNLEPIFSAWLPAHDAKVSREALAAWMIEHSYATGHGDTFENMLKELVGQAEARRVERAGQEYARIGDEVNQCLQAIISNAGNIADSDTTVENHAAARIIESSVQRAVKAIRFLAKKNKQ